MYGELQVIRFSLGLTCILSLLAGAVISSRAAGLKTLATFDGSNGSYSIAPLVQGADGSLFGTTFEGGVSNLGTVFRVTPRGRLISLYSFCKEASCSDGKQPGAQLVQVPDGDLYGTTESGGNGLYGGGTVFRITSAGNLTTLYAFCLKTNCPDGSSPNSLIRASDGSLYGTTYHGGANGWGTVFRVTTRGKLKTLYSFCGKPNCTDGGSPEAALLEADDGSFYGTTSGGNSQCAGSGTCGTVFRITGMGRLTTLHRFCSNGTCEDGADPYAGLTRGTDGNLYGTTDAGGRCGVGTVFKITLSGIFKTIYSFCTTQTPQGTLVRGADQNFYGTTSGNTLGTIFKITPSGNLTTLYNFCSRQNCRDGYLPLAGLIEGKDGAFYGTTALGGNNNCDPPHGCGTIFRFSMGGPLLTVGQKEPRTRSDWDQQPF